jgi:hypothetical protein
VIRAELSSFKAEQHMSLPNTTTAKERRRKHPSLPNATTFKRKETKHVCS